MEVARRECDREVASEKRDTDVASSIRDTDVALEVRRRRLQGCLIQAARLARAGHRHGSDGVPQGTGVMDDPMLESPQMGRLIPRLHGAAGWPFLCRFPLRLKAGLDAAADLKGRRTATPCAAG